MPLSTFEHYMYLDNQCGNAMTFFIVVEVEGIPDRETLEAAIAFAAERHPFSTAMVEQRWRRPQWIRFPESRPPLCWTKGSSPTSERWRTPDLLVEPGMGVFVEEHSDGATLTFRFHHVCCDGLGAMQWIEDVLVHYANARAARNERLKVRPLDPERLRHRATVRNRFDRGPNLWKDTLREIARHCLKRPRPLDAAATGGPQKRQPPAVSSWQFTKDETRQMQRFAYSSRATLNDLLLRELLVAISTWNRASDADADPWYRINMPMSMRDRSDVATPAANLMSMTFINRRRSEVCGDQDKLLSSIAAECRDVKATTRSTLFLDGLSVLLAWPAVMRCVLRLPICMATATLSNLGDPCRRFQACLPRVGGLVSMGGLRVTRVGGMPPLRARTHAGLGVNLYSGRLGLDLQMTPGCFSRSDAERFLQCYAARLRQCL